MWGKVNNNEHETRPSFIIPAKSNSIFILFLHKENRDKNKTTPPTEVCVAGSVHACIVYVWLAGGILFLYLAQ